VKLTPVQMRVVGVLVEKERTTPDNYPLSMNALLNACNQTTNRDPIVEYDERVVGNALENLKGMGLVRSVYGRGMRVDKYRHVIDESLGLSPAETAVLAVLMLRGPQTAAELRTRTDRLHDFADQAEVDRTLAALAARQPPLVELQLRRPGQKQERWVQLLCLATDQPGAPVTTETPTAVTPTAAAVDGGVAVSRDDFLWFVDQSLDQMVAILRQLGDDRVNRRPDLPGANSPYAIVTHCLGVTDWWAGHVAAGRSVARDRDAEFRAAGRVDDLVERLAAVRGQLEVDVGGVDALAAPRGRWILPEDAALPFGRTQGGALLHVYEELQQHLGQLELTRDLLLAEGER
jgi:uncharacterized protein YceH (UPF0502 family)